MKQRIDSPVRVAILEDHQGIIDGYIYRLSRVPSIEIVGIMYYAEELEDFLRKTPTDLLIMDLMVPISPQNPQSFPALHTVGILGKKYPRLRILVVSMLAETAIFKSLVNTGIAGYILKDDYKAIQQLAEIVEVVARGGAYFSNQVYTLIYDQEQSKTQPHLSPRQLEVLSLLAAYPFATTEELASKIGIAASTLRNTLSELYRRLNVPNRLAALAQAQKLGLVPRPLEKGFNQDQEQRP
jgi:two-component system nitrate/nitrite response regulator NarL